LFAFFVVAAKRGFSSILFDLTLVFSLSIPHNYEWKRTKRYEKGQLAQYYAYSGSKRAESKKVEDILG